MVPRVDSKRAQVRERHGRRVARRRGVPPVRRSVVRQLHERRVFREAQRRRDRGHVHPVPPIDHLLIPVHGARRGDDVGGREPARGLRPARHAGGLQALAALGLLPPRGHPPAVHQHGRGRSVAAAGPRPERGDERRSGHGGAVDGSGAGRDAHGAAGEVELALDGHARVLLDGLVARGARGEVAEVERGRVEGGFASRELALLPLPAVHLPLAQDRAHRAGGEEEGRAEPGVPAAGRGGGGGGRGVVGGGRERARGRWWDRSRGEPARRHARERARGAPGVARKRRGGRGGEDGRRGRARAAEACRRRDPRERAGPRRERHRERATREGRGACEGRVTFEET